MNALNANGSTCVIGASSAIQNTNTLPSSMPVCSPASVEPLQRVAYLYDGTLEGLLCCAFEAYARHEDPEDVLPEQNYQPRFEQSSLFVETNYEHALRVRRGVEREAGKKAFCALAFAAVADNPKAGIIVYRFIRYVMDDPKRNRRLNVLNDLSNPIVADLSALRKRTANEVEKMCQFVRFSQLNNGIWFARCNPNSNVIPLVMNHFASRFNIQPFIIHDEVHHISGVYDGNTWYLVADDAANMPERTPEDAYIEALWRQFYNSLSIQSRYNPELRQHFMPARLWKHLPEVYPASQNTLQVSN